MIGQNVESHLFYQDFVNSNSIRKNYICKEEKTFKWNN